MTTYLTRYRFGLAQTMGQSSLWSLISLLEAHRQFKRHMKERAHGYRLDFPVAWIELTNKEFIAEL